AQTTQPPRWSTPRQPLQQQNSNTVGYGQDSQTAGVFSTSLLVGSNVEVINGTDAILQCNVTVDSLSPEITWLRGPVHGSACPIITFDQYGQHHYDPYDRHSFINNSSLLINTTVSNDTDTYWCEVQSAGITLFYDSLYLSVVVVPKEARILMPATVIENDTMVEMTCFTSNTVGVEYSWFVDGHHINKSEDHVIFDDKTLMFIMVTRYNTGQYNCCVHNIAGDVCSDTEMLEVLYLPDYPWPACHVAEGHYLEVGETIVITCQATDGNPNPSLTWFNGINPMDICNVEYIGEPTVTTSTCEWILKSEDNGQIYICNSTHDATDEITSYSPFIVNVDLKRYQQKNDKEIAQLTCQVSSNPAANITWFNSFFDPIINTTKTQILDWTVDTNTTSMLTIYDVTEMDYGEYICYATNVIGDIELIIILDGPPDQDRNTVTYNRPACNQSAPANVRKLHEITRHQKKQDINDDAFMMKEFNVYQGDFADK
uniref:Carcinoembryonic antigen-related cell adhesion molecule 5-like n=1 Tax=Saccoglossus kowalevskii TaxID=10224 RepID=A0ABM0MVM9_SACKO